MANKIILSRKGFDSKYGGMASPILPDGRLLSIPIPDDEIESENDNISYSDIKFNGETFSEIFYKKLLNDRSNLYFNKNMLIYR